MHINPATVEYEGKTYVIELGEVTNTYLGYEDHGIFSFGVSLSFGSGHQGTGQYFGGENGEHLGRFVKAMIDLTGANWENFPGVRLWALRVDEYGLIKGFMNESQDKILIIDELFKGDTEESE